MAEIVKSASPEAKKDDNPANVQGVITEKNRIPFSTPMQKLEVPPGTCPGYHLHWFNGDSIRIQRALQAGYEFVTQDEVQLNDTALGGDGLKSGSTDMGSKVSRVCGGGDIAPDGQPNRLYLMKIKQEWWIEDQKQVQKRNAAIAEALTAGTTGVGDSRTRENSTDARQRYLDQRTKLPDLFNPNKRRPLNGQQ